MLIALDYDDTYSRDPVFWDRFLQLAASSGHRVICLTMRYPEEAVSLSCDVFYTSRKAKKPFAENLLLHVDIWIDDAPHFILMDSIEVTGREAMLKTPGRTTASEISNRGAPTPGATGKPLLQTLYRRVIGKFFALRR